MMITSRENAGGPDDVDLGDDYAMVGLSVPCVVRPAKVASVMHEQARLLGRLPPTIFDQVKAAIARSMLID